MDGEGRGLGSGEGPGATPGPDSGPVATEHRSECEPTGAEPDGGEWPNRRDFLRGVAASFAAAGAGGLGGCLSRRQAIVPYVVPPEQVVPGRPLFFATGMPLAGYGIGVLAESHMGRPTKIEGNPDHPASLGATDARTQASVLSLYDPDRAQTVTRAGLVATWAEFVREISAQMDAMRASGGAGLRLLTGAVTSPTLAGQIRALLRELPQARWHCFEPASGDGERRGTELAFGRSLRSVYRLDRARRILSLDSDFLLNGPGVVRYNRDFAAGRRVRVGAGAEGGTPPGQSPEMHRLYVVESTPTIAGAMADHRLALRASEIEGAARTLLNLVRAGAGSGSAAETPGTGHAAWLSAAASDLLEHRGAALVIAGEYQPGAVHAVAAAMNEALGAVGATVDYIEPVETMPDGEQGSLRALVEDMNAGAVSLLVMLDTNPVYTAPADLGFAAALDRVPLRIHQSEYYDETSFRCHWHVPQTHYLEMWGDIRAFDGTASIIQPLIHPLFQSRSPHELLAVLLGTPDAEPLELVRETWRGSTPQGTDFEPFWRSILERGVIPGTAAPPVSAGAPRDAQAAEARGAGAGMEIIFRPDPGVFDGRFANNGWLQELPRPLTKVTWDNVAAIGVGTAERLGVGTGDVLRLRRGDNELEAPAWVQPGHPEDAVTVTLGYGRTRAGRVGSGAGFDAYALRTSDTPWFGAGLEVARTGRHSRLAVTQPHQTTEGRDMLRVYSVAQLQGEAASPHGPHNGSGSGRGKTVHLSLYPPAPGSGIIHGHEWGMAIDLNLCTGCNACVVACQAENNVPVVGKAQVLRQREMHWLRIDTYYRGDEEESGEGGGPYFQPMLCQHCGNAPCEYVCPVLATTHSAEGINEMTYNRCIGTRYCANNCPYKVRRFNFLQYSDHTPIRQLQYNPDVTVRTRGVMEKCTFCVQRLNAARRDEKSLRSVGGPEADARADAVVAGVRTACQQACPTGAIVFGELMQRGQSGAGDSGGGGGGAEVRRRREQPHSYGVLTELNTAPRVTYLARLVNPNPALGTAHGPGEPDRSQRGAAKG